MNRRPGGNYWFALFKMTATRNATTYWLDGNPSTYRWWAISDNKENVQCVRYTHIGFGDRSCHRNYQYTCKMAAGTKVVIYYTIDCLYSRE